MERPRIIEKSQSSNAVRRSVLIVATALSFICPPLRAEDGAAELQLRVGQVRLPAKSKADLTPPAGPPGSRYVVQFRGPLQSHQRDALAKLGLQLGDYVPKHAYVIKPDGVDLKPIAALDFVRHVGPFKPEWKIDPVLSRVAGAVTTFGPATAWNAPAVKEYRDRLTFERQNLLAEGKVAVTVSTHRGASLDQARTSLEALPEVELRGGLQVNDRAVIEAVVPLTALGAVAQQPFVQFIEDAPQGELRNATTGPVIQSGMPGVTPIWDQGLWGQGQIFGLIDAAPRVTHCMFEDVVPIGPTHRKIVAVRPNPPPSAHPHGTHVAGTLAGDAGMEGAYDSADGIAFAARFSFSDFFAVNSNQATLLPRLIDAHNDGARIHSNSWGDDSTTAYTLWCNLADQFSYDYEDDLVCFAATNTSLLRTPENAKNVLSVGASRQYPFNDNHCMGGRGPTADGRRKPDIFAPGCSIVSASSYSACGTRSDSGTSFACPAIAASAALVRQYFVDGFYPTGAPVAADALTPSGALMKAAMLNATVDMTGVTGYPSDQEGWGRPVLDRVLHFAGDERRLVARDVRNASGLTMGQSASFKFTVLDDQEDLKVTMVFTDPPAAVGSANPVVNNLDLVVTGPTNGAVAASAYLGNHFVGGQSVALGTADAINNVEQVSLLVPAIGTYTVEVTATEINGTGPQGYAVVVSGGVVEGEINPPLDFGDFDGDGDIDLLDFAALQICFTGQAGPRVGGSCEVFDGDQDGDVDEADYIPFRQLLDGPAE